MKTKVTRQQAIELIKKNNKKKAYIDGNLCIGCGGCKRNCKFDAIYRGNEYYIINQEKCTGCEKCFKMCPADAITMQEK